jgi:hypothetical protein
MICRFRPFCPMVDGHVYTKHGSTSFQGALDKACLAASVLAVHRTDKIKYGVARWRSGGKIGLTGQVRTADTGRGFGNG